MIKNLITQNKKIYVCLVLFSFLFVKNLQAQEINRGTTDYVPYTIECTDNDFNNVVVYLPIEITDAYSSFVAYIEYNNPSSLLVIDLYGDGNLRFNSKETEYVGNGLDTINITTPDGSTFDMEELYVLVFSSNECDEKTISIPVVSSTGEEPERYEDAQFTNGQYSLTNLTYTVTVSGELFPGEFFIRVTTPEGGDTLTDYSSQITSDNTFSFPIVVPTVYPNQTIILQPIHKVSDDEIIDFDQFTFTVPDSSTLEEEEPVNETKYDVEDLNINKGCKTEDNTAQATACDKCIGQGGIWTAIGCVDVTPLGILTGLIRIAFGVMGGVALVQLIIAGLMYQSGQDAKIAEAKEKFKATLFGIALLVFSVLILRILGINVLDVIPIGSV